MHTECIINNYLILTIILEFLYTFHKIHNMYKNGI